MTKELVVYGLIAVVITWIIIVNIKRNEDSAIENLDEHEKAQK